MKKNTKIYIAGHRGLVVGEGVNNVYEGSQYAKIVLDTDKVSVEEAVKEIVAFIKKKYIK